MEIEEIKKFYGFKIEKKIAPNCSKIAPIEENSIAPNCSKLLQIAILLQNDGCKAICEYCLKTFSRNSNLTKHLKTCKKKKKKCRNISYNTE